MARRKQSEEARIVRYFQTASQEKVELMLSVIQGLLEGREMTPTRKPRKKKEEKVTSIADESMVPQQQGS